MRFQIGYITSLRTFQADPAHQPSTLCSMSHVPRAAFTDLSDLTPGTSAPAISASPASSKTATTRLARRATRINDWMRRYSRLVAMTVTIVITVGGLVILESGRMRIASEYETALDAEGATAQLSAFAADIATLTAEERAYGLRPDSVYKDRAATQQRVKHTLAVMDAYYRRLGNDTALTSFAQVIDDDEIERGAVRFVVPSAVDDPAAHARALALPPPDSGATLDAALSLLRLNEDQRAQQALDASRADQRISTLCVGALCALNIVLFVLLFAIWASSSTNRIACRRSSSRNRKNWTGSSSSGRVNSKRSRGTCSPSAKTRRPNSRANCTTNSARS